MDKYQLSQKSKLFKTEHHDPYLLKRVKGVEICPQCNARYQAGNWTWSTPENTIGVDAKSATCPACRRIADDIPGGVLTLLGEFQASHRTEIINLIRNTEKIESVEHALERIIKLNEQGNTLEVTTTGVHLANRIGHALKSAYDGQSNYRYSDDGGFLSVTWERD